MNIITEGPGDWQAYPFRSDNIGLTTEQLKTKYLQENLQFQSFVAQQLYQLSQGGVKVSYLSFSTTDELMSAVRSWFSTPSTVEEKYGPIGQWNVSLITEFEDVFSVPDNDLPATFNEDISGWDMSNATDLSEMFQGQINFNQNLSNWDVSNVTVFDDVFKNCAAYNNGGLQGGFNDAPLNWDVSSGEDFSGVFNGAAAFNQNINSWNVSNATDMEDMFKNAAAFNKRLDTWNVEKVTNMTSMFNGASTINLTTTAIASWNPFALTVATNFMTGLIDGDGNRSGYAAILIAWGAHAAAGQIPAAIGNVDFGAVKYNGSGAASTGRAQLVSRGFVPLDGGTI